MAKRKKERVSMKPQGFESNLGGLFASLELPAEVKAEPVEEPSINQPKALDELRSAEADLLSPIGARRPLRLSLSKKGRGGKVVSQLALLPESAQVAREQLARGVAKALGCRAWVEGEHLCLQGDQRERLTDWVAAQEG